jgi:hypothetical protein
MGLGAGFGGTTGAGLGGAGGGAGAAAGVTWLVSGFGAVYLIGCRVHPGMSPLTRL